MLKLKGAHGRSSNFELFFRIFFIFGRFFYIVPLKRAKHDSESRENAELRIVDFEENERPEVADVATSERPFSAGSVNSWSFSCRMPRSRRDLAIGEERIKKVFDTGAK